MGEIARTGGVIEAALRVSAPARARGHILDCCLPFLLPVAGK